MSIVVELGALRLDFLRRFAIVPAPGILDPARSLQGTLHGIVTLAGGVVQIGRVPFSMSPAEVRQLWLCMVQARGPAGAVALSEGLLSVECSDHHTRGSHFYSETDAGDGGSWHVRITLAPREQPYLDLLIRAEMDVDERGCLLESLQAVLDAAEGFQQTASVRGG